MLKDYTYLAAKHSGKEHICFSGPCSKIIIVYKKMYKDQNPVNITSFIYYYIRSVIYFGSFEKIFSIADAGSRLA